MVRRDFLRVRLDGRDALLRQPDPLTELGLIESLGLAQLPQGDLDLRPSTLSSSNDHNPRNQSHLPRRFRMSVLRFHNNRDLTALPVLTGNGQPSIEARGTLADSKYASPLPVPATRHRLRSRQCMSSPELAQTSYSKTLIATLYGPALARNFI